MRRAWLLFWLFAPLMAAGASLPMEEGAYSYNANGTALPKMFADFGKNFGLRVQVAGDVTGVVNGRLSGPSPSDFLDSVTRSLGLQWFYLAGTLHISLATDWSTRSHAVPRESVGTMKKALTDLGVLDAKFGWAALPEQGLVLVSGPRTYLDLVASALRAVQGAPNGEQITIVRLKYANVEDRVVMVRDRPNTIPGIKTLLRSLGRAAAGATPRGAARRSASEAAATAAAGQDTSQGATPAGKSGVPDPAPESSAGAKLAGDVGIEADVRLNAIVLRGPADALRNYEALIASLDVPAGLVQIEALTVDVNKTRLDELGIDWSVGRGRFSAGFGDSTQPVASGILSLAYGSTGTTVADQAARLLARLRLLEESGDAYVLGRPSIVTSDNMSAMIDLSQTFYTRVAGERVANLEPVTAGIMLKVTPRIVAAEGGGFEIQLSIDIEDGTLIDRTGVELPVVQKTSISTQAIVREGQSLLIGGYDTEARHDTVEAVPGLSRLPAFGALFRSSRVENQRRKRMFLITPRLVGVQPGAEPVAPSGAVESRLLRLEPMLRLENKP
jgi:type III secretion protein C